MSEPLRLLFPTQSIGLSVFWQLHQALAADGGVGECGFFVTHQFEHARFLRRHPGFATQGADCLREWELLAAARRAGPPDLARIADWEARIGDASLWHALVIDRRLGFRLSAQFRQDYRPSYDHESLLALLGVALEAVAGQFDRVRPHAVVALNAVTMYDYLYYLMARERRIPYFQLKLTRVRNYVSLYTDPFALSPHIVTALQRLRRDGAALPADGAALAEARALLAESRGRSLTYEGAIRKGPKPPAAAPSSAPTPARPAATAAVVEGRVARLALAWRTRELHYPSPWRSVLELKVLRPLRRRRLAGVFALEQVDAFVEQHRGRYCVYPLNTEPEVALLAFGRPYRNQIETVRNLAIALPVGWKLVVKEHPNAFGYRTRDYYRKLRAIPNVVLAAPGADTARLVDGSGLVAMVFGTIGLEAIIKGRPLVALCSTPYDVFPPHMVRYVADLWHLGDEIRDLLATHRHDESEVEAFLAAHVATGIRINLFTGLLAKGGRETIAMAGDIESQYAALARYTRLRIIEEQARLSAGATSCAK